MRKITFGVANSLDNRIARKDDAIDWLTWSDEVASFMEEFWKTVDTVLMGRKTYEITSKMEAPVVNSSSQTRTHGPLIRFAVLLPMSLGSL